MPSFESYKVNIYKSNTPIYFPDYANAHWADYKDNLIGSVNWVIPYSEDPDFVSTYNAEVGSGWGNSVINYLTGIITDTGKAMNDLVPWGWCGSFTVNSANPAKITAYGRLVLNCPSTKNLYQILSNNGIAAKELFVLEVEGSACYMVTFYGDETTLSQAITGGISDSVLRLKSGDQEIDSGSYDVLSDMNFSVTNMHVDSQILVHYNGGYAKVFFNTRPDYEGTIISAYPEVYTGTSFNTAAESLFAGVIPVAPEDPFSPGGETDPGGGTGTFDDETEPIDFPSLPTLSAVDTGFITLFNPSASELKALANYMWGSLFDISTWKKIFADPMDAILGLSIVPVAVDDAGPGTVTVGNISTGVSMNKAASQYKEVDCGSLNILEYWGAYLDYDPYTKAELYLPYCGTHPIAVDDVMGKEVHIKYHVDILSGSCCCYVKCGTSVLYTFAGQCSCSVPITGNDWTNVVNGALSIAASIGTMVATGGATAPMAAGAIASTAVNSMKPTVEKSGSLGGMAGMLAIQKPYLILTRPRQALPKDQNKFSGYPSFINKKLGSVTGYTEVESIHLEGIQATDSELAEIENLLKSGVIF